MYQSLDITSKISRWTFFLTFLQSPAMKELKNVKRDIIQISAHNLVIFNRRGIIIVPALEFLYFSSKASKSFKLIGIQLQNRDGFHDNRRIGKCFYRSSFKINLNYPKNYEIKNKIINGPNYSSVLILGTLK